MNKIYLGLTNMRHIKETDGMDFLAIPTSLTESERKGISEFIAYYKRTGKKMPDSKSLCSLRGSRPSKSKAV